MPRPTTEAPTGAKPGNGTLRDARDLLWPLLVTFGLLFVVLVNMAFIWIATSGQDTVVESYMTESR